MPLLILSPPQSFKNKRTFAEISVGVGNFCGTISQGSSFLATLGYMMESRWDSPMGARQARDLEQTIAGNVAEILEA